MADLGSPPTRYIDQNHNAKRDIERPLRETPPHGQPFHEVKDAKQQSKHDYGRPNITEDAAMPAQVEGHDPKQAAKEGVE